jgi:hypothetical protein
MSCDLPPPPLHLRCAVSASGHDSVQVGSDATLTARDYDASDSTTHEWEDGEMARQAGHTGGTGGWMEATGGALPARKRRRGFSAAVGFPAAASAAAAAGRPAYLLSSSQSQGFLSKTSETRAVMSGSMLLRCTPGNSSCSGAGPSSVGGTASVLAMVVSIGTQ